MAKDDYLGYQDDYANETIRGVAFGNYFGLGSVNVVKSTAASILSQDYQGYQASQE